MSDPRCKVHFVYLIPTDKTNTSQDAITRAAQHLQAWYKWQMGGKTFQFDVRVFNTHHNSSWYANNINGDPTNRTWWFWNNTLQEAADLAGAGFYQPYDDWVIYVDATPYSDQGAGGTSGGYTSGCAVLADKDLASLRGQDPDWTQCRGIGGSGHEMGHTFGLPHPPPGDPHWGDAIMGVGYSTYPNAILRDDDKIQLNANPFFDVRPAVPPAGLCPFQARHLPPPRPKPAPPLRPPPPDPRPIPPVPPGPPKK